MHYVVERRPLVCLLSLCAAMLEGRTAAADPYVPAGTGLEAAVAESAPAASKISFNEFLSAVAANNLDYAAQRYNVSIAEAAVVAASAFQNPTLASSGSRDVSHGGSGRLPDFYNASLTQTFEIGGKRKYRILGAGQTSAATAATLEEFLRNLKLDAAAAFADALALARSAEQKRQAAEYLNDLAATQRERRHAGDISQADMLETSVEARQFHNDLLAADAEAEQASLALNGFLGPDRAGTRLIPTGALDVPARDFDLSTLLAEARQKRPDLVALRHARDASQSRLLEERANRIPNIDLGPEWTHGTKSDNSISPAPAFDAVGLSLSVALPIWNRNGAAIATAEYTALQAQKQLDAAELKAEVQLRQALTAYRSAGERVRQYQSGILKDADAVLEARRFSYQRGQSTLLELLEAQRAANDVRSSYTEAVADNAKALIELERSAGLWEIEF